MIEVDVKYISINSNPFTEVLLLERFGCNPHLMICLLILEREEGGEREKEGERNIDVREKHQSVASCMRPDQGSNPQPRYVP